jgi:Tfp pilus assembly protein PilF
MRKIIFIILGLFLCALFLELGLRVGGAAFISLQGAKQKLPISKNGVYTIMCLGESTTALGGNDSYPSQLEEILNEKSKGMKFSVINKGIPATNTAAILLQLEENLNKYKPDMVVAMMGNNDEGITYYKDIPEAHGRIFRHFALYRLIRLIHRQLAAKMEQPYAADSVRMFRNNQEDEGSEAKKHADLGFYYKEQGEFIKAAESFKRSLEFDPKNDIVYMGLGYVYVELRDYEKMEQAFKKAIEINPENVNTYAFLAHMLHSYMGKTGEAEALLRKAIDINPGNENVYFELGWFYQRQKMPGRAAENFKKAISINPHNEKACGALAILFGEMGRMDDAEAYYNKIKDLPPGRGYSMTTDNYYKLNNILSERGVRLVCVQYPMRSIVPLKEIFSGHPEVLFVDNENIFKEALKREGYKEYFLDMFAGDFGHCTRKGNRLLASNIASVVLKDIYPE